MYGVPLCDLSGDSDAKPVYHNGVHSKPHSAVATKIALVFLVPTQLRYGYAQ